MWFVTALGVTVGLHRYFTHKSFSAGPAVETFLAVAGMMAVVGPLVSWVGIHRRHHEVSDQEGDPHSPHLHGEGFRNQLRGFYHAQFGWLCEHDCPNPNHYAKDWLKNPRVMKLNRWYMLAVLLGLLLPAVAALLFDFSLQSMVRGLFWAGIVRIALVHHLVSSINSVCHLFGSRRFDTPEHSTNFALLALPTLGESWHNNHHAFQTSATFSHRWFEFDGGYLCIRLAERLGLVWNVRGPRGRNLAKEIE